MIVVTKGKCSWMKILSLQMNWVEEKLELEGKYPTNLAEANYPSIISTINWTIIQMMAHLCCDKLCWIIHFNFPTNCNSVWKHNGFQYWFTHLLITTDDNNEIYLVIWWHLLPSVDIWYLLLSVDKKGFVKGEISWIYLHPSNMETASKMDHCALSSIKNKRKEI